MDRLRIDRWLWCARLFKTRSLAAEKVKAGHVRINGQRTKPARELKVGDALTIARDREDIDIVVAGIPLRRGPAAEAAGCYTETAESIERRRLRASQRAAIRGLDEPTPGRPDKRTRRLIRTRQRHLPGSG